jgi:hypothetical protein
MITLKILSALTAIGVFLFTYHFAGHPGFKVRHLAMLAASFVYMGVPVIILLALCALNGQWLGFFFFCGTISAFALGSAVGYVIWDRRNKDPFHGAMILGIWTMIIAGTPLAVYLLP